MLGHISSESFGIFFIEMQKACFVDVFIENDRSHFDGINDIIFLMKSTMKYFINT
jgi:hypothetical protein